MADDDDDDYSDEIWRTADDNETRRATRRQPQLNDYVRGQQTTTHRCRPELVTCSGVIVLTDRPALVSWVTPVSYSCLRTAEPTSSDWRSKLVGMRECSHWIGIALPPLSAELMRQRTLTSARQQHWKTGPVTSSWWSAVARPLNVFWCLNMPHRMHSVDAAYCHRCHFGSGKCEIVWKWRKWCRKAAIAASCREALP